MGNNPYGQKKPINNLQKLTLYFFHLQIKFDSYCFSLGPFGMYDDNQHVAFWVITLEPVVDCRIGRKIAYFVMSIWYPFGLVIGTNQGISMWLYL